MDFFISYTSNKGYVAKWRLLSWRSGFKSSYLGSLNEKERRARGQGPLLGLFDERGGIEPLDSHRIAYSGHRSMVGLTDLVRFSKYWFSTKLKYGFLFLF